MTFSSTQRKSRSERIRPVLKVWGKRRNWPAFPGEGADRILWPPKRSAGPLHDEGEERLMSPERVDPDSLLNHPGIVAAVKSGDIKRLNRLLAELAKEPKSAEKPSS